MSASKQHTPGPYIVRGEIEPGSPGYAMGADPASDDAIAPRDCGWPYFIREDRDFPLGSGPLWLAHGIQRKADADLFAAAPEMASAIEAALVVLAAYIDTDEVPDMCAFAEARCDLEAAIAKARGWPESHCVDCGNSLGRISDRAVTLSCEACA